MIKINRRGQGSHTDILIWIIVGLITLALLLGMIFRADLLNWMRNLPDYGNAEEDRIIDIEGDNILSNVTLCEEVGKLVVYKQNTKWYNVMYERSYDLTINGKATKLELYIREETNDLDIRVFEGLFGARIGGLGNDLVGSVSNGHVYINDEWINDNTLRVKHPNIPSSDDLKLVDDAYLDGLKLCKKK